MRSELTRQWWLQHTTAGKSAREHVGSCHASGTGCLMCLKETRLHAKVCHALGMSRSTCEHARRWSANRELLTTKFTHDSWKVHAVELRWLRRVLHTPAYC